MSRFPHRFINLGRYVAQDKFGPVAAESGPIRAVQQLVDFMLSENRRTSLTHWLSYLGGGTMPTTVDARDTFTQRFAGGLSEQPEGLTEFASHVVLFVRSHFDSPSFSISPVKHELRIVLFVPDLRAKRLSET
jgi:hypothetical protein